MPFRASSSSGGLGYRILVDDKRDFSRGDLRRALFPKLQLFADLDIAPLDDPVASSLAWCYQRAFSHAFGIRPPEKKLATSELQPQPYTQGPVGDLYSGGMECRCWMNGTIITTGTLGGDTEHL